MGESVEKIPLDTNDISFKPLAASFPAVHAFSSSIFWLVILAVQLIADHFVDKINMPWFVAPIMLVIFTWSAVFSYFSAKARGYTIDEYDVYFKQGLWWQKQTALNFSRIQHVDISHGPLERKFDLATIKFFTAGGVGADLKIAGLSSASAEHLRLEILKYATDELKNNQTSTVELLDSIAVPPQSTENSRDE
ncbi:MAG: PH domain-containing protein [Kangiellaceae bacterium]|jgi:membrane protein YdbS with pleckstrin-like domain|nr:PH domain-containing protein [Kangiellaceae bacterium]